jgi:hypothetical protein
MKLFFESAKICEICGLKRIFDLVMAGVVLVGSNTVLSFGF